MSSSLELCMVEYTDKKMHFGQGDMPLALPPHFLGVFWTHPLAGGGGGGGAHFYGFVATSNTPPNIGCRHCHHIIIILIITPPPLITIIILIMLYFEPLNCFFGTERHASTLARADLGVYGKTIILKYRSCCYR